MQTRLSPSAKENASPRAEMMHPPFRPALPLPPSAEGHMTRRAFEHLKSSCDGEALLRRAGLTLQGIEDPQARIGAESQIAFLKLASEALDDPLLGFHLAESFEPRELGLLYYVQASSATLGEALGRVARYSSVAHEGLAAKCVRGNALTFRIDNVGVPRHTDRHQMEFLITGLVRIFRKLTNTHLRPIRVRLAHPRSAASDALEDFLGQSVEFGAGHDERPRPGSGVLFFAFGGGLFRRRETYAPHRREQPVTLSQAARWGLCTCVGPTLTFERCMLIHDADPRFAPRFGRLYPG
jgi:hypothetical protein